MRRRTLAAMLAACFALGSLSAVAAMYARRAILGRPVARLPVRFSPPPDGGPRRIVTAGNSLVAGSFLPAGSGFSDSLARVVGPGWRVVPRGVGAMTTREMIAAGPPIDELFTEGGVLVVWEASNGLFYGATADDEFGRIEGYCRARRAAGWRVVILTVLPRDPPGLREGFEVDRATLNARIRERWRGFADALADVAADPDLGGRVATGDRRYYLPDRTHLTILGASVAANVAAAAVLGLPDVTTPARTR